MRVLFTTTAGLGHLHPLVPLAHACRGLGHEVRVAAPTSIGPALTERRLAHEPLPDYGPHHLARVEAVMRELGPPGPGSEVPMLREVFGWAKTDATLAAMRDAVTGWRPDIVLHEAAELSGPLAAEAAGVAHATVATGLRGTMTRWVPYMAEGAADLATSIGLPVDPGASRVLDVPYATLVPPSLEEPGSALPDAVVRYRLTDLHLTVPTPDVSGARPLVWVSFGTEAWRIPGMSERLVPILSATAASLPDVRFLLTTGAAEARLPTMPGNVQVHGYVPQERLLDACDAVVGHGGFNTAIAALTHGRPQVAMPLFATDQFETAGRLAEVGAGVAVTEPSPSGLRVAIDRVLSDPAVVAAAGALADEMAALPTPAEAMATLLASVGTPPASVVP